jgi:hypothetical protein
VRFDDSAFFCSSCLPTSTEASVAPPASSRSIRTHFEPSAAGSARSSCACLAGSAVFFSRRFMSRSTSSAFRTVAVSTGWPPFSASPQPSPAFFKV